MGWRVSWRVSMESDREGRDAWPSLVRWAVVGLAVLGVAAVLIAKGVLA